jgi:hypothetical protein
MEIDSEVTVVAQVNNLKKLVSDILGSSQSHRYAFLVKAVGMLGELRDLINQREIEDYVSRVW